MLKDQDIREPLFEYLEDSYGKVRIIEEKNIGKSRADVVMVMTDCIAGIEIKSDADTYARLSRQVKDYDLYFDYNYIVVGTHHGLHVKEHVPDYWGIITVEIVDGKFDFYKMRDPDINPKINYKKKMEILWKTELSDLLKQDKLPKYTSKSKRFVAEKLIAYHTKNNTIQELSRMISDALFEREYSLKNDIIDQNQKHYCYMVRCRDGSLYTGYAVDPLKRLSAHNSGRGAKYTRSRRPVSLVFVQEFNDKQSAMRREYEIKHSFTKEKKEKLIEDKCNIITYLTGGGK